MIRNENPIIVEQIFELAIDKVWYAITNGEQMRQWYFNTIPDFKPEVGFETKFDVQSGTRTFTHLWKVTEVQNLQKIKYNWSYEQYEGDAHVEFEISENNSKTNLKFKCFGIENFTQDIPEFSRESCQAGWNFFIKDSLKKYLEA